MSNAPMPVRSSVPAAESPERPAITRYTGAYLGGDLSRVASYRVQAQMTLAAVRPADSPRVLNIGKGNGIADLILERCGIPLTTLDIRAELQPDIVASVESIPVEDGSFDCVLCCQVLEHLPFDRFRACLAELRRVCAADAALILSLPDQRRFMSIGVAFQRRQWNLSVNLPRLRPMEFPEWRTNRMGHHWEIGFAETPIGRVREEIAAAGWTIRRTLRVRDLPWHTFFDCR